MAAPSIQKKVTWITGLSGSFLGIVGYIIIRGQRVALCDPSLDVDADKQSFI